MKKKEVNWERGNLKASLKIEPIQKKKRDPKVLIAWIVVATLVIWFIVTH